MPKHSDQNQEESSLDGPSLVRPEWLEKLSFLAHGSAERARAFLPWLEARQPLIGRQFKNLLSGLRAPFTLGMGIWIERLDDEVCLVRLPYTLRSRAERGYVHQAAVAILAETAVREFWLRHLLASGGELELVSSRIEYFKPARSELRARYECGEREREASLFILRAEGSVRFETLARVYDSREQMIAEANLVWDVRRVQRLSGR